MPKILDHVEFPLTEREVPCWTSVSLIGMPYRISNKKKQAILLNCAGLS